MFQILSIRTGAFILTSFRIVCIILFLVCLSIGTLKVVRLEAQIQERQRQIKDGNDDYVNAMEQGDYFCGTSVLPCTQFLRYYHYIRSYRTVILVVGFSLTGASLVTNILVLVGIHYEKPRLLQPWLWYVMFFLALGILSVVAFVLLGFFYAFFTSGLYWDIYGYVVIFHILSAPLWSFELCVWIVIQATLNKLQKGAHSNPNKDQDDTSSTHFSTKL